MPSGRLTPMLHNDPVPNRAETPPGIRASGLTGPSADPYRQEAGNGTLGVPNLPG